MNSKKETAHFRKPFFIYILFSELSVHQTLNLFYFDRDIAH